ncbi:ABC transporter substrate-binding protein [Dysgonomonas mossii]|uniref:Iron ABC transporter substrate-binding protein n=2 Tax=Dysgonomonas mossii TaxID=163665 RepID=A0A4Y9IKM2_9BACT|nr:ABC transporter substrate-binding protein [Dysgonomonas mossii]MBF0762074.1 ABC transporter substrate-binding protein [Dysgonomonas mossii]TFU88891.1 iron ABC transporter substrate-binding protein [Dysgonomonas mossii]
MKKLLFILFTLVITFSGCNQNKNAKTIGDRNSADSMNIKYAKGFKVISSANYKLVDITDPSGESDMHYKYALVNRGSNKEGIPADYQTIEIPVCSVICMTTLQLSNFIKLNALNKVVGITSTRFLFNEQMNRQIKEGKTSKIGIEGEFDNEAILALNPDIILVSPFKKGGYDAIRNLDIPLISFLGYKESSPLGQAEWIKFIAMLLGIEEQANKQFDDIENKYNKLKVLSASVSERPTVLSGELHSGNWYVVGGNSYLAQLFRDAGADYFMKNDNESGGFYVDFETVYSQGANTDYWRMVNSHDGTFTYDALKQSDARYADFKAFKDKKLIYCNLREKPFYENTPVEPEVVLADLIKIFHPSLLPEYVPVYYELLK